MAERGNGVPQSLLDFLSRNLALTGRNRPKKIKVVVRYRDGRKLQIDCPPPDVGDDTPVPPAEPSACERDVLEVLGTAGKRLTTAQILDALNAADKLHHESTVQRTLAKLVENGTLQANRHKPYGYVIVSDAE